MRVGIVGGGVAGLQTAAVLGARGHACVVFERAERVGGVWRANYAGFGLQVPSELYEFRDHPRPALDGTFLTGAQVQAHVEQYARAHAVDLRLRTTVVRLEEGAPLAGGAESDAEARAQGWRFHVERDGAASVEEFDYCVVCTGMYSMPHVPRAYADLGTAVHSSDFADARVAEGKRVVVVGAGKSAVDCAVAASRANAARVTLAARAWHWPVPRRLAGLVPFQWGTYSRLGHWLLTPPHWRTGAGARRWHARLAPLKRAVWWLLERLFAAQFALPAELAPAAPLPLDLFAGGQILDGEFATLVRANRIECACLADVDAARADLVVCATGFRKEYALFDAAVRERLDVQDDGLWLYRYTVPPRVARLAFVGAEVSTFNNILTHSLQAEWLAGVALQRRLPSRAAMDDDVARERAWKRAWMPASPSRAALVQLHMTPLHDLLRADVGAPRARARWWQALAPLTARDYPLRR